MSKSNTKSSIHKNVKNGNPTQLGQNDVVADKQTVEHNDQLINFPINNIDKNMKARSNTMKESKTVTESKDKCDKCDKFEDLSCQDVQINLRLLGDLKEGEKIMIVDGRYMQVDQRYAQCVRRYMTEDSRTTTIKFVDHIIKWATKYCTDAVNHINENRQANLKKLIEIQTLLRSSLTGLSRMAITYNDDKHNLATIETYRSTIQNLCDQDLKSAIENDNNA